MATTTYEQLKAYAEKHFPVDFAKLPSCMFPDEKTYKSFAIRIGSRREDRVYFQPGCGLQFKGHEIKLHEPFCWVQEASLDAFLRFCLLRNGFEGSHSFLDCNFLLQFEYACADIAHALWEQEAAVDVLSKWGVTVAGPSQVQKLQNDILQLATTVDALKSISAIEHKFFKQKVEASEAKIKTLEYQFADFKAEVQTPKAEAGKDGVDWVELFAASKVENEKLKKNLTNTVTEKVVLEQQVAELRMKLSE